MLTNNEIKFIKSLQLKKYRDKNSLFIVEGEKVVNELIESDFLIEKIYGTNDWYDINYSKIYQITLPNGEKHLSLRTNVDIAFSFGKYGIASCPGLSADKN